MSEMDRQATRSSGEAGALLCILSEACVALGNAKRARPLGKDTSLRMMERQLVIAEVLSLLLDWKVSEAEFGVEGFAQRHVAFLAELKLELQGLQQLMIESYGLITGKDLERGACFIEEKILPPAVIIFNGQEGKRFFEWVCKKANVSTPSPWEEAMDFLSVVVPTYENLQQREDLLYNAHYLLVDSSAFMRADASDVGMHDRSPILRYGRRAVPLGESTSSTSPDIKATKLAVGILIGRSVREYFLSCPEVGTVRLDIEHQGTKDGAPLSWEL